MLEFDWDGLEAGVRQLLAEGRDGRDALRDCINRPSVLYRRLAPSENYRRLRARSEALLGPLLKHPRERRKLVDMLRQLGLNL